ncbi:DUF6266 family protein [Sphingobacterium tabacisoli]|uniref:DUF6266 family protein n=1 Tax=Sphingobacterium tabacisoli TaxID=2044855 RepID=A0ABW5KX95_9SPHI|nr:DUF6266 family protein [Sphingobacterium tabacisoli]
MLVISEKKIKEAAPLAALTVRQRFAQARFFINPLNSLIRMGFSRGKKVKSPIGQAMSFLIRNAMVGEYPDIKVDPALAKLSNGSFVGQQINTVFRQGDTLVLEWTLVESRIADVEWDDELILCAYDVEQGNAAINEEKVLRRDEKMETALPSILHGRPVHLYLVVHDRDRKYFSRSQYLGFY